MVAWYQVFLFNINNLKMSIWPIDRTLTGLTTLDQSEPGHNSNSTKLQKWSLITGCSLLSYPGCPSPLFWGKRASYPITGDTINIFQALPTGHTKLEVFPIIDLSCHLRYFCHPLVGNKSGFYIMYLSCRFF